MSNQSMSNLSMQTKDILLSIEEDIKSEFDWVQMLHEESIYLASKMYSEVPEFKTSERDA